jgi:hypothetical protein
MLPASSGMACEELADRTSRPGERAGGVPGRYPPGDLMASRRMAQPPHFSGQSELISPTVRSTSTWPPSGPTTLLATIAL